MKTISNKEMTKLIITSSDMSVAIDRPTSWYLCWLPMGPSCMKMNRVGTQTSVRSANRMAFCRRIKATRGSVKHSTSPTRIFAASAPGGIFFRKCSLNYRHKAQEQLKSLLYQKSQRIEDRETHRKATERHLPYGITPAT